MTTHRAHVASLALLTAAACALTAYAAAAPHSSTPSPAHPAPVSLSLPAPLPADLLPLMHYAPTATAPVLRTPAAPALPPAAAPAVSTPSPAAAPAAPAPAPVLPAPAPSASPDVPDITIAPCSLTPRPPYTDPDQCVYPDGHVGPTLHAQPAPAPTPLPSDSTGNMASGPEMLPPCAEEDSDNCYWDATVRGNGLGQSFWIVNGVQHYYTPTH